MLKIVPTLFWLAVWLLLSISFDLEQKLLPDFTSTLIEASQLILNVDFLEHIAITFARVIPGNVVSVLLGVPVGIALAQFSIPRQVFAPFIDFVRGVPAAALFPVVIILFGIGETARIALTMYVAFPIIVTSTMAGAIRRPDNEGRRYYLEIHSSRVPKIHSLLCLLWDALPSIFAGLKIAISLSLVIIIVSEMFFVGGTGIGWFAWNEYQAFNIPKMYAAILLIGVISIILNLSIDFFVKKTQRFM